ncbi:nicotine blue oxidoreductase [mine drainage metagenome]|uniref:Nicotine blue oxidoreductase n=1 Tax=mine drainage metagenome TaxID=410659 RepID=A0A1J5NYR8_9ZZZZ
MRFGGPKAPYLYRGERLVDLAVGNLREGGCDRVLVVLGAWVGEVDGAEVLHNPNWQNGLSTSLGVALDEAVNSNADRICVTLVDLPGLTGAAVSKVLADESDLIQATYRESPTHPVVFARSHWAPLRLSLSGDSGAREYLKRNEKIVAKIPIDDLSDGQDLDFQPI